MQPLSRVQGYGHVAKRYGLEESIFLEAVMYWYRTNRAENRNYYDGRWWTHTVWPPLSSCSRGGPASSSAGSSTAARTRELIHLSFNTSKGGEGEVNDGQGN